MSNNTPYNFIQVSCDIHKYKECSLAYYIWRTVPFILIPVGTCGNILNFVLLSRKGLRKYSTSVYLLFLAGSDLVVLWTGTALDTNENINGIRLSDVTNFTCKTVRFLVMASGGFSVWLLVLLTFERVFLTRFHFIASTKMTPKFAALASTSLLIVIIIFSSHLIFGFELVEIDASPHLTSTKSEKLSRCLYSSAEYELFFSETWGILVLLFLNVIPMFIIILGNLTIALTIVQQSKKLRRIHPETSSSESRHPKPKKSPTKILFVLSGAFLVTTFPYSSYMVVQSGLKNIDEHSFARHQLITAIILMLVYSNFTCNFFLYFVSGTLFKVEWRKLVAEVRQRIGAVFGKVKVETQAQGGIHLQHIS